MNKSKSGRVSPSFLKYFDNDQQVGMKCPEIPDELKIKLALEMRDRIFETCQKDLLRYDDLMKVLGLSRDQAFKLMRCSSFPVKRVNGCNTITAIALAHWMLEQNQPKKRLVHIERRVYLLFISARSKKEPAAQAI